jgi:hypothetical protein
MTADRSIVEGVPPPQGLGEDPFVFMTKVYLVFLQGLFQQRPAGEYRWSSDPEQTEILITDQAPIPVERIEQRPAIVSMRGPVQFANMTLDQLRELDRQTGERIHTDMVSCTMTLNCISKAGIEAQKIAWTVMRHIRNLKREIQRAGHIHKIGDEVSMGPETPPGSLVAPEPTPEMVNVTVFSPFHFQWTERVAPRDSPTFEELQVFMRANLHPDPGEQELTKNREQLKRPTIRGVPINGTSTPISNPILTKIKI